MASLAEQLAERKAFNIARKAGGRRVRNTPAAPKAPPPVFTPPPPPHTNTFRGMDLGSLTWNRWSEPKEKHGDRVVLLWENGGRTIYFETREGFAAVDGDWVRHHLGLEQGNSCAICGRHEQEVGTLHLDHNHTTREVRALLCRGCNHGIGHLRDDPAALRSAAEYLENF